MKIRPGIAYWRFQEESPFHIDYCFVPEDWVGRLRDVSVEPFETFAKGSDHRPLTVEVASANGRA